MAVQGLENVVAAGGRVQGVPECGWAVAAWGTRWRLAGKLSPCGLGCVQWQGCRRQLGGRIV